jgi:hypothetical protein
VVLVVGETAVAPQAINSEAINKAMNKNVTIFLNIICFPLY